MNRLHLAGFAALVLGVLALGAWMGSDGAPPTTPAAPLLPPCPPNKPCPPRKPWLTTSPASVDASAWMIENTGPDGTQPIIDYPQDQWIRNIGSKIDGAGMCVFSSAEMMFRYSGLEEFRGFRDWCAQNYPGGGYPEKLAKLIKAYCNKKGIPEPVYYQYEGSDTAFLDVALKTGRMVCCTLYNSKRYGGRISHMVNGGHSDARGVYCIIDNNQMRGDGVPPYEWFKTREEFINACGAGRRMWFVAMGRPGAPPMPRN